MIVVSITVMQYYAALEFADYINGVKQAKLDEHAKHLATEYRTHQGWESLKNNPDRWRAILIASLLDIAPPQLPPHHMSQPPPHHMFPPPPPHMPQPPAPPLHWLSLYDKQKHLVIGNPAPLEEQMLRAIEVDGKTVGWIGIRQTGGLSGPLEAGFLEKQYKLFALAGIGILVLTALVTFFLSRHILVPIRQLADGTRALISRRFKTRIKVRSTDELGQLASDFNIMAQQLEKYEQMRQQWISDISHELRTPLSILRGEIEALQDGIRETTEQSLDSLYAEVVSLGRLVEDLHLLSLADSQDLVLKKDPVKPLRILKQTLNSFQTRLNQRKIDIQLALGEDGDITMAGDSDRLTQLFSNILENTLRYADSPATLRVSEKHTKTSLTINFEDSGPGVPTVSLERLFDRLYRVDKSRSRALAGSGLGLSICKHIVEGHGGEIDAAKSPLGGLWVKIEFPLI